MLRLIPMFLSNMDQFLLRSVAKLISCRTFGVGDARLPQSEYPMNIFYIIGVVVVVVLVAGFLGLRI